MILNINLKNAKKFSDGIQNLKNHPILGSYADTLINDFNSKDKYYFKDLLMIISTLPNAVVESLTSTLIEGLL